MFQALMDRIDEEILRWTFLYQPVAAPRGGPRGRAPARRAARPAPRRARRAAAREPELALAGVEDGARAT